MINNSNNPINNNNSLPVNPCSVLFRTISKNLSPAPIDMFDTLTPDMDRSRSEMLISDWARRERSDMPDCLILGVWTAGLTWWCSGDMDVNMDEVGRWLVDVENTLDNAGVNVENTLVDMGVRPRGSVVEVNVCSDIDGCVTCELSSARCGALCAMWGVVSCGVCSVVCWTLMSADVVVCTSSGGF